MSKDSKSRFTVDLDQADRQIAATINSSPHFQRLMGTFCRDIGPRPAGSPAMRRGVEFLAQQWKQLGVPSLHTEPVPVRAWQDGGADLQVLSPPQKNYPAIQYVNSASLRVEAPLVDAGNFDSAAIYRLGRRLRGAVILLTKTRGIRGGKYTPTQKAVSLAEAAGASAVIATSWHRTKPAGEFIHHAGIPVLGISLQAGEELADLCRRGAVRLRLEAHGSSKEATCLNLIGQMGPQPEPREIIASCFHLDSLHLTASALDDLSGGVTLTEIARTLAPYQDRFVRNWRIFAFTAEEHMFVGSRNYVRAHPEELDRFRFILSLDCLFETTAQGTAVMWASAMRDYIAAALAGPHPEVDVRNFFCMSSDYLPFMLEGIAAARPADWKQSPVLQIFHTTEDTEENLPPAWLRANALVYARLLLRMLTDRDELPAGRKTPEEIAQLIQQDDAEEALRWQLLSL